MWPANYLLPIIVTLNSQPGRYVYKNAEKLNVDNSRVAIADGSSGGNLAGGVTLLANERNIVPIVVQALFYPLLDILCRQES
jgi:acetyl esterase/lipase